jgi:tetratricopeptide (TPR) repeat protein
MKNTIYMLLQAIAFNCFGSEEIAIFLKQKSFESFAGNNFATAEAYGKASVHLYEELKLTHSNAYAQVCLNTGAILYKSGKHDESETFYQKVHEFCLNTTPLESKFRAESLNQVAIYYQNMGRFTQAEKVYESILIIEGFNELPADFTISVKSNYALCIAMGEKSNASMILKLFDEVQLSSKINNTIIDKDLWKQIAHNEKNKEKNKTATPVADVNGINLNNRHAESASIQKESIRKQPNSETQASSYNIRQDQTYKGYTESEYKLMYDRFLKIGYTPEEALLTIRDVTAHPDINSKLRQWMDTQK